VTNYYGAPVPIDAFDHLNGGIDPDGACLLVRVGLPTDSRSPRRESSNRGFVFPSASQPARLDLEGFGR
jgi:hypothetical protein